MSEEPEIKAAGSEETPPQPEESAAAETDESADAVVVDEPDVAPDPVAEAKAEAAKLRDQLLRTAADFDNYRKRARRDVAEAEISAREELLKEILPVFDNLERAAQHAETATDVQGLSDGIKMVMRIFVDTLAKLDIHKIESVGKPFDPALHEAIQHMASTEYPPGTVAAEVQPGYRLGERLMRPAMVVVAKAPAPPAEE